ncbi:uncharacterized protein LOC105846100 isoform X2 [Hydra vulgaris]|uniref:uncharacterized protein LOC105846100 isoform X2 n=1 Tax=Hydra vulgaris TaxID=6087 RepID=UPI001F5EE540|nr:uncharacterized protein LOC105846100 isoform X2 [Hydra vulgaris]
MRIKNLYLLILYSIISLKLSASFVVPPPTFAEEPQDTWFFNSSSSKLSCVANQDPVGVAYQWMYETEIDSKFTNLTHIQVDKYGAYVCLLSNSFGTVRSRTALVKKPVIVYRDMKNFHKNIINGGYLFLPSLEVYESIPPIAEIFWQKKKKSQQWEVLHKDSYTKNGSLLIRKVNAEEHNTSFSYIMKQKNGHSVAGYTVTVNIIGISPDSLHCKNNYSLALIEVSPNVTLYVGQEISIECLAFFNNCSFPPTISWFYNYSSVENQISRNKAVLNIFNSNLSNSGNYICEVAGYSYIPRVTRVTVLVKPSLNIVNDSVTFYVKNNASITLDTIALTSRVGLKCFEWYFNGKSLSANSKYNYTSDYKLIVNQPVESDSGIYQVFYFFDGFELKHAFNAFFVYDTSIMVTDLLTSTSTLFKRVSTTDFKTLSNSTEAVKVFSVFSLVSVCSLTKPSSIVLSSAVSIQSVVVTLPSLVSEKELIKITDLLTSTSILSSKVSTISFMSSLLSSFKSSCPSMSSVVSTRSVSISNSVAVPTLVLEKKLMKNDALITGLSVGSAVLIIGLLIGLIMRKRCFIKNGIEKKGVNEMALCEKKRLSTSTKKTNDYEVPVNNEYAVLEKQENTYCHDEPNYQYRDEPNYHIIEAENYNSLDSSDNNTDFNKKRSKDNYSFEPEYKELEDSGRCVANDSKNYASIYACVPEVTNDNLSYFKNKVNPTKNVLTEMKLSPATNRPSDIYTSIKNNHVSNKNTLPSRPTDIYTSLNNKDGQSPEPYAMLKFNSSTEKHAKNS